jgi:hypothetical protein
MNVALCFKNTHWEPITLDGMTVPMDVPRGMPNCGVVACAIAAGVSYNHAWNVAKKVLGKSNHWKGRTSYWNRRKILHQLGVKVVPVPIYKRVQVRNWMERHAEKDILYMVKTGSHVMSVLNNNVADQFYSGHISNYPGAKQRVSYILRILN